MTDHDVTAIALRRKVADLEANVEASGIAIALLVDWQRKCDVADAFEDDDDPRHDDAWQAAVDAKRAVVSFARERMALEKARRP